MQKLRLCVLFGGASSEHEISLMSAKSVISAIPAEKYDIVPVGITRAGEWYYCPGLSHEELADSAWERRSGKHPCTLNASRARRGLLLLDGGFIEIDVAFPVLHGENGEDGRIQGLFELAGVPFVGPGCEASAVAMDKAATKLVAATTGVRQAKWMLITCPDVSRDGIYEEIESRFEYPMFIKPAGTGSSVGTSKAKDRSSLVSGLSEALRFGGRALVEEFIDGHEIETAVIGNADIEVSCCGEILPSREFYSYESKYIDDASEIIIPAHIDDATTAVVRDYAGRIYKAVGCKGLSRVDFFVTRDSGEVVFNEINTIPGFTDISMYAKLFDACGVPFSDLLERLIELALEV